MLGDREEGNQSYGCSYKVQTVPLQAPSSSLEQSNQQRGQTEQRMIVVSAAISREKSVEDKPHSRDGSGTFKNLPRLHYCLATEELSWKAGEHICGSLCWLQSGNKDQSELHTLPLSMPGQAHS